MLKRIQKNIANNPTEPVRRLFDKAVEDDSGDSADLPEFSSVRTRSKRFRAKFIPELPQSINDVNIVGEWRKSWKGKKFLSHIDNRRGIVVFCTRKMLHALQQASCIYVDGTFRTAPKPYFQLVSIHGKLNGFVIPLAFVLMTGKTTYQYRHIFAHLKQQVQHVTNQAFLPSRIVCDFEKSLMNAIELEFPNATLSGCYFHFNQSLWRNVQKLQLTTHYNNNRKIRKTVKKVMAIGFLPMLLVRQNFNLLCNSRRVNRLTVAVPALNNWLTYVENTYISRNAVFPPRNWNVYDRSTSTRTNNHLEGSITSVT